MPRPHRRPHPALVAAACLLACAAPARAHEPPAPTPGQPADPKALKSFLSAEEWLQHGMRAQAIDSYRKANQQDGGHCAECLRRAYALAMQIGEYKQAAEIGQGMLEQARGNTEQAAAHYRTALAVQNLGIETHKKDCFAESCTEFSAALQQMPQLFPAHFGLGISYAHLHQDEAARREFSTFLANDTSSLILHRRAQRFLDNLDLARATMAPPFELTTLDGQRVSLDGFAGKVVLIDFWATWCAPCREALPHIRDIARRYAGQPLVVLSISLDSDEAKWKSFVANNAMTWLQYRDGSNGLVATQFGVHAIPATFTIDADGVLQDQHVGDAEIEWKLKKLITHAAELATRKQPAAAAQISPASDR